MGRGPRRRPAPRCRCTAPSGLRSRSDDRLAPVTARDTLKQISCPSIGSLETAYMAAPITALAPNSLRNRHRLCPALPAKKLWLSSPWLKAAKRRAVFAVSRPVLKGRRLSCPQSRPPLLPLERILQWSDPRRSQY